MTNRMTPHVGSALDDLLEEDGVLAEARSIAVKRVFAWQISRAMAEESLSKAEMARRMSTSRASLDRLLDPGIASRRAQAGPHTLRGDLETVRPVLSGPDVIAHAASCRWEA